MSTNEIIIKTLFREVSAHVGQDDLSTAQRLLDRAAIEHRHNPEVERFLAKVYRNLGLERPIPEQDIDLPDMPSDDDLAFLAEQEAIHREEEFAVEETPTKPPGRRKLRLKPDRDENGKSADGPKIVYRGRAAKSAAKHSRGLPESPLETPTATPAPQNPATVATQVDTDNRSIFPTEADGTHKQAGPDQEQAPQLEKKSTIGSSVPASSFDQAESSRPTRQLTAPDTRTPLSQPSPDEDKDSDEESPELEDWEQEALFSDDDDLAGDELDDEEVVEDSTFPAPVDTDKELSFEDLLALDEWDDPADEEDGQDEELDTLGLEERLTLEDRARQVAIDFTLENDLEHSWLDFLTEVFTKRRWGAVRNAMQWAVDRDISLEQLMLARALRVLWYERQDYWINFNYAWARTKSTEATHQHLSWRFAIRTVAAFESVPSMEELEVTLEWEYEYWLNHSTLRRAYPVFLRYLTGYRFSSSPRLLPASYSWHFEAEESNEPAAFSLEPDSAADIKRQMIDLGVDLSNRNPCKSYAFSDIPMDTLLKRFEKPEKDGKKSRPGKNAKHNKNNQTTSRVPAFPTEETTS